MLINATKLQQALPRKSLSLGLLTTLMAVALAAPTARAQERPYFLTYTHHMEEPGHLEIATQSTAAPAFRSRPGVSPFVASLVEFEYGVKGWWTSEWYLDGQATAGQSTLFTGWRWENRFRPLLREHWINPVLYVEFEDLNGADKTMREVVGFDGAAGHAEPNHETRREREREIELKLILSSNFRGWNVAENFIAVKNITGLPWEFGYAFGAARPFALAASARECSFCPENFQAGVEMYGGLGAAGQLTVSGTSHYVGPVVSWAMPSGATVQVAPSWGLTRASHKFLFRAGVSYEVGRLGQIFQRK